MYMKISILTLGASWVQKEVKEVSALPKIKTQMSPPVPPLSCRLLSLVISRRIQVNCITLWWMCMGYQTW